MPFHGAVFALTVLRQVLENLVDALREAHVEHLVGLVEHHVRHVVEHRFAAVHQVDQASRRGHDDLRAVAQGAYLLLDAGAAVDGHHMDALHILREVAKVVGYLQAELARGTEHEGLRLVARGVNLLQERYAEGRRLARARLCEGNHIVSFPQQIGDYFLLDGHRLYEAHLLNGVQDLAADAQFFKCLQCG